MSEKNGGGRSPKQPGSGTSAGGIVMPFTNATVASTPGSTPTVQPPILSGGQQKSRELLMNPRQLQELQMNIGIASMYVNSRHLEMLSPVHQDDALHETHVKNIAASQNTITGITAYELTKLVYNEEEDSFEKLATVYSALNSYGCIVAMIIRCDGNNTKIYLCTRTGARDVVAGRILQMNLKGQFPGCELTELNESEKQQLLDECALRHSHSVDKTVRSLSMIPSRREAEMQHDKHFSAQGFEKYIDAMRQMKYTLVILSQPVSAVAMDETIHGLENLYTSFSSYAKETVSYGETESDTVSFNMSSNVGKSISKSISHSFGTAHTNSISYGRSSHGGLSFNLFDVNFNSGMGSSFGTGFSSTVNSGRTSTDGEVSIDGEQTGSGTAHSRGQTLTTSVTRENKSVANMLLLIDEHLKRIRTSQTFGMWNSACYLITEDIATATIGTSTLAAVFSGDSAAAPRAYYNQWDLVDSAELEKVLSWISTLQHPVIELEMFCKYEEKGTVVRRSAMKQDVVPAIMISGREVPLLMGLPRKSVTGVTVDHMPEFGRNIPAKWLKKVRRKIEFGEIQHMGMPDGTKLYLDLDAFASHIFITGSTGSGKSNTTYHLLGHLIKNKVPFLVIEPAKGEYKMEFAKLPGINIYTAEETAYQLLRINPFEFHGVHIRVHLDLITEAICACWPLYGPMPGILKRAIEEVYITHGWDLDHSERIAERGTVFPVFKDLERVLENIIENSPYSKQTKGDYKGALLNRVSMLSNGFEGQIFGHSTGIPDNKLFNEYTIIDLSSIGSDETRGLIMGILLIKLRNYRKYISKAPNSTLQHVTVFEEAHNLLKRCSKEKSTDSGNSQGASVASMCKCIAEMRSYGEGFMIIDQSPTAVDEVALKNTAIKIVMQLPAKTDFEEMGGALSLTDIQSKELSRLPVGAAAVFHRGWPDAILAKMGDVWNGEYRISTEERLNMLNYTRFQGAIVQSVYHNILHKNFDDIMRDTMDIGRYIDLPENKRKELEREVQLFINEYGERLKKGSIYNAMYWFGKFAFDFLHFESLLRICQLKNVKSEMMLPGDTLTEKEKRLILSWEREIRKCIQRYLVMPRKCNPSSAYNWSMDLTTSEYFWPVYSRILHYYADRSETHEHYAMLYNNAMDYLDSINYFDPGSLH